MPVPSLTRRSLANSLASCVAQRFPASTEGPVMEESVAPVGSVGHRLTRQRTLCGLTRSQLAAIAELDLDLITQVEQGIVPIAVPVELGDAITALAGAEQIKIPTGEEPARVGRYWIDLARAWVLYGDHAQALDALHQADQIAPQLSRYHPQAHETRYLLTEYDRRATDDSLADFAHWAGITL